MFEFVKHYSMSVFFVLFDYLFLYVNRGMLVRSILQAQSLSPTFTHVYAALVSIINTKVGATIYFKIKNLTVWHFCWTSLNNKPK